MKREDFKARYEHWKKVNPQLFELMQNDPLATDVELDVVEKAMGSPFEPSHRAFLKEFGGGDWGFTVLFSASETSEWYVLSQLSNQLLPKDRLFPVSDNFAGDTYGFEIVEGKCTSPLKMYDHETLELVKAEFADVYEYMDKHALKFS